MKIKTNYKWLVKVVLVSVAASMAFTLATTEILGRAGYMLASAVLAVFIIIGIAFDMIGVAVTAAPEAPFHSMAVHREKGAVEALRLIKNADKVASICNDVVGDVSGVVSGSTAALIAAGAMEKLGAESMLFPLLISGAVTGMMIGGKAAGKALALNNSIVIVLKVGKMIGITQGVLRINSRRARNENSRTR